MQIFFFMFSICLLKFCLVFKKNENFMSCLECLEYNSILLAPFKYWQLNAVYGKLEVNMFKASAPDLPN